MKFSGWIPEIEARKGPVYLRIVDAIAADVESGKLERGARLPPQRVLAGHLGIDFTTVSRAYTEAQRRGLVEARVGKGTFVRHRRNAAPTPSGESSIDMMVNHPPRFDDPELDRRLWHGLALPVIEARAGEWMRYQPPAGSARDRAAGASWLTRRIDGLAADRLLVCPGTQGALLVATMLLAERGDVICVEELTYPGFILIAQQLGIRLVPIEMDAHGACPESLAQACRQHHPKALYCMPTLHNPTTTIMPVERRRAIADVLRRHAVPLIEDDNYWPFVEAGSLPRPEPVPPLASFMPELAYYITGLAKCVTPAIRIAYMVTPDRQSAGRAAVVLRATASMASPFNAALASQWIEDGTAAAVLKAICDETAGRRAIAQRILPGVARHTDPRAFHLWLHVPAPWTRSMLAEQLRMYNISIAVSDAFSVTRAPEAVRLCLGGPLSRADLEYGLQRIAELLALQAPVPSIIV
jgi:DNA-binding transcriptional MocR family regulator